MGVDITYECIGPCTYRIYHNTYYDCSGNLMINAGYVPINYITPNPPGNPGFMGLIGIPFAPGQNCNAPVPLSTTWTFVGYQEVTPICPGATTQCDNPNAPPPVIAGVAEARYYRDYDFCNVNCDRYTIEWDDCCRNNAITSGAASDGIFTGSTEINTTITPCNSSPQFSNPPIPYVCLGETFTFNQGAFDPDGDSLAYSFVNCFQNNGTPVGYLAAGGFDANNPLGSNWDVTLNAFTGDITIAPDATGPLPMGSLEVGVLCLEVREYRNGVQIGQVVRDMQITVIDCSLFGQTNIAPTVDTLIALTPGATVDGLEVTTCACQEICIDIPSFDPDPGQNYIMYWNGNLPGTFADVNSPFVPVDSIFSGPGITPTGQFCWVPTVSGPHTFLLTVQDDGCPLLGQNQYTIVINVVSCSLDPFVDINQTDCFDLDFTGYPCGGAPPFTYSWSGSDGLSGNTQNITHSYSGPGTYFVSMTISDSLGASTTVTDTIFLTNTAVADAGPDLTLCSGEVGTIGAPAIPGSSYQWNSLLGQGWAGTPNPSTAQGMVTLNNLLSIPVPINYTLEITDINGCTDTDTVSVLYAPRPASSFNVQQPVCENELTSVVYTGASSPNSVYHWNFDGGVGFAIGPGPHQVVWPTSGTKEVELFVEVNGCPSDTNVVPITVHEIPTSNFTITPQLCANETAQITYTGSADPGAATFTWDLDGGTGSGGANFQGSWSTPGTKTVTLTVEENGCESSSFSQTITVLPLPEADFFVQSSLCEGDIAQITYTGSSPFNASYAWTFGGGTVLSGGGQGPYQVQWPTPGQKDVCLQLQENG
ncbi:MAG: PKD domain-containing protein, partial [Bacteroidota bacterium]